MRFKKSPQLAGAGRTKAWHWSDTPTSPRDIYVLKSPKGLNIFGGVYCPVFLFLYSKARQDFQLGKCFEKTDQKTKDKSLFRQVQCVWQSCLSFIPSSSIQYTLNSKLTVFSANYNFVFVLSSNVGKLQKSSEKSKSKIFS